MKLSDTKNRLPSRQLFATVLAAAGILTTPAPTFALTEGDDGGGNQVQLQNVLVVGSRFIQTAPAAPPMSVDPWFAFWIVGNPGMGWGNQDSFDRLMGLLENVQNTAGTGTDTRTLCTNAAKRSLAGTVSTADPVARNDAVRALVGMFAAKWAQSMVWSRLIGQTTTIAGEQFIRETFTFADGGTEAYYINVLSSDNARPVPSTLRVGDGVPKNVPCQ